MKTEIPTHLGKELTKLAEDYTEIKGRHKHFKKELIIFAEKFHEYKVSNFIL
jgi:hypothetical protein